MTFRQGRYRDDVIVDCDKCSDFEEFENSSWADANIELRKLGWIKERDDGEWYDICPECASPRGYFTKVGL